MGDRALVTTAPCPDSLACTAAIKGGFSHRLFTIVNDCIAFPVEENRPLHVDTGMKSFCLLQSVFQHFCLQFLFFKSHRWPQRLDGFQQNCALVTRPRSLRLVALHKDLCQPGFSTETLRCFGFARGQSLGMSKRDFRRPTKRYPNWASVSTGLSKLFIFSGFF